jgi:hypothetical protein
VSLGVETLDEQRKRVRAALEEARTAAMKLHVVDFQALAPAPSSPVLKDREVTQFYLLALFVRPCLFCSRETRLYIPFL